MPLLLYLLYHHPAYNSGNYIKCTQTLYAKRVYWWLTRIFITLCDFFLIAAVFILIEYHKDWTKYIIPLILAAMSSRDLIFKSSIGIDITTKKFCQLQIPRGKGWLMILLVFFTKTNSAVFEGLQVEYLKKVLPDGLNVAPDVTKTEWYQFYASSLCSSNENNDEEGSQYENIDAVVHDDHMST